MQAVLVQQLGKIPKLGEFNMLIPLPDKVMVKVLAAIIEDYGRENIIKY